MKMVRLCPICKQPTKKLYADEPVGGKFPVMKVSKTKVAANVGGLNAFLVLLPGVLAADPTAIGQMVILIIAWVGVLWGRGNKG